MSYTVTYSTFEKLPRNAESERLLHISKHPDAAVQRLPREGGSPTSECAGFPSQQQLNGNVRSWSSAVSVLALVFALTACGGSDSGHELGTKPAGTAVGSPLAAPEGVALDAKGNLYVSEFEGARVVKIAPNGTLGVVAGIGTDGYSGDGGSAVAAQLVEPAGLAVAADGSLAIADHGNDVLRNVDPSGRITTIAGSKAAALDDPIGLALADGELYIADELNARLVKLSASGRVTTLAGGVTAGSGRTGDGGPATNARLRHPSYVVVDAAGDIYLSDFLDNRIRKIDRAGVITTIAGTGVAGYSGDGRQARNARLNFPTGLALDAKRNLYISDANNHRVRRIGRNGVITTVAGTGIQGFGGDGGSATAAKLDAPAGLAIDATGNLFIADQGNDRVRKVNSRGVIATVAGGRA